MKILVPLLALALLAPLAQAADKCAFCNKSIEGTPYVMKNKTQSAKFKCVYCAVAEANEAEWKGDVFIVSPSENPKKPVTLKRVGGQWKQFPASATFVEASPIKHRICGEQFRAFTTKAAAQKYVQSGAADSIVTLAQLIKRAS